MYTAVENQKTSDFVNAMLRRGKRIGVPSRELERELLLKAQAGDEAAMDHLLHAHSLFVQGEVMKNRHRGIDVDDMFAVGLDGLRHAIINYNLDKYDCRLISIAVWWIKQRITTEVYNTFSTIRIPVSSVVPLLRMRKYISNVHRDGTPCTVDAYAEQQQGKAASKNILKDLWHVSMPIWSLNEPNRKIGRDSGDEVELQDGVISHDLWSEDEFDACRTVERLMAQVLTDRERFVVVETIINERILHDVGLEMGCSRERVRQIRHRALEKMATRARHLEARSRAKAGGFREIPSAKRMPKNAPAYEGAFPLPVAPTFSR